MSGGSPQGWRPGRPAAPAPQPRYEAAVPFPCRACGARTQSRVLSPPALKPKLEPRHRYKARPFGYVWAEGGKQPAIEEALGVGGFGYPALVAYAPKDAKLSTMRR